MGEHQISAATDTQRQNAFMKALLADVCAMERMLETGIFESGVQRIGGEQEMFLVDAGMRPAPVAMEVLKRINDPRLTTEIARFNLEANLTPRSLEGRCFHMMEQEMRAVIGLVREAAAESGADVLLAGILPTLHQSDLTLENMTPIPRYREIDRALTQLRGGSFQVHMKGLDELQVTHDNVLLESCNTSFQVHLQIGPKEFARMYNLAQAITGPVLAAAVNSPVLLSHRLWHETRVALFQHSVDERSSAHLARGRPTRVSFGDDWISESILEVFREDIARFRVILSGKLDEDPMQVLDRGEAPLLSALRLHNGTVWRWNRPCYGIIEGRPHLRIENRALPSGPTILDEVANAAFFIGLMRAMPEEYGSADRIMSFDDAKDNFFAAARHGLKAQFNWAGGQSHSAAALILKRLLPLAREGLKSAGIPAEDISRYLGTIEDRVSSGQTGAQWMLQSLAGMDNHSTREIRFSTLASAMLENQKVDEPVHRWPLAELKDMQDWPHSYQTVGQYMVTDLFTVRPGDLVDLAASVMQWKHVRHVPVEDDQGRLVGILSHRDLLKLLARGKTPGPDQPVLVSSLMKTDPVTVTSDTPTLEAIELMRNRQIGCLPVVEGYRLVGILTAHDFLSISARLFEEKLKGAEKGE